ncbi:MAG: response regulator [Calditrichaeota bacterium]|nr:MAG: response regulator [Calditrichota bacterium]MBL1203975.1 response regulator [Calditrichota bacterium]NOG43806.1 response regulator [Calditrichota bacterium]
MKKVLIVDRDSSTLNDISRLVTALNYEPVVAFNTTSISGLIREEIVCVFIDVETKMINVEDVVRYFNGPQKLSPNGIIPIYFLCTNPDSYYVEHAKQLPHTDLIKKPVTLEAIFDLLYDSLNLEQVEYEQFSNHYKLTQLKKYSGTIGSWLEKFGSLLDN